MLTRREPYDGEAPSAAAQRVRRGFVTLPPPPGCAPATAALLRECLEPDPRARPAMAAVARRVAAFGEG